MRILDKNTDFYDFIQHMYPDNTFTFDRTDSFLLTKELMCKFLSTRIYYIPKNHPYRFLLLQVGNTFWLFFAEITEYTKHKVDEVLDYKLSLLAKWKNFNKPRELIKLDVVEFKWIQMRIFNKNLQNGNKDENSVKVLVEAVNNNDFHIKNTVNEHAVWVGDTRVVKHIPLLKACGMASLIEPLDIYLAFEEYFSLEKSSSERIDPKGITDKDKIEAHGFDKKTSFRN